VENKEMYPVLVTLARRMLAAPATSANAEKLFSKAAEIQREFSHFNLKKVIHEKADGGKQGKPCIRK